MGKGKKELGNPQVDNLASKVAEIKVSSDKQQVLKFPLKPVRKPNERLPGRPVSLIANLFKLSLKENKKIHKYTIDITEIEKNKTGLDDNKKKLSGKGAVVGDQVRKTRKLNNNLRTKIVDKTIRSWISNNLPKDNKQSSSFNFVYDANGSIIYTLFDMFASQQNRPNTSDSFVITIAIMDGDINEIEREFEVKIYRTKIPLDIEKLEKNCKLSNQTFDITQYQEDIRAINVLLHANIINISSNVVTKYSVFPYLPENQFQVSDVVLFNKGYSLSARPSECGLLLNVANTGKAFYKAIELIRFIKPQPRDFNTKLNNIQIENLKRDIVTRQVEAIHHNYGNDREPRYHKYRVTSITSKSCSEEKFHLVDNDSKEAKEITILDYFKKKYNYRVKYPNLPCIDSNGRKIPIEVCKLVEKQGVNRKMTPDETSKIIREMAVKPDIHFKMIENNIKEVKSNSKPLSDFGIEMKMDFVKVIGREIDPLGLIGKGKPITPHGGEYDTRATSFFRPVTIKNWRIVFFGDRYVKQDHQKKGLSDEKFAQNYNIEARAKGIIIENRPKIEFFDLEKKDDELKKSLKNFFKEWNDNQVEHCIIILPDSTPDWIYPFIQYLEVSFCWPKKDNLTKTSCIKYKNYMDKIIYDRSNGKMFISNLLLKHNTKLGGINFILAENKSYQFLQQGYIFLSVDVCHPAPGDKLIQSVAAVVGMWNLTNNNLSYCTRMRVQKKMNENHSTIEEVGEIGSMIKEIFDEYGQKERNYPTKIVILRDGVSEGQFTMVLQSELVKVKQILTNMYQLKKLKLAPITCFVVQKRHKIRLRRENPIQGRKGPDYNIQPGTVVSDTITHPTDFEFYSAAHKAIQGTSRPAKFYAICNELQFDQAQAEAMMNALSYLSPRCTKSTSIPTPVNLADLAAERGKNIVVSWQKDNKYNSKDEDDTLNKLNSFLKTFAYPNYKNTLYYV